MISLSKDDRELVVRINLDEANPLVEKLWDALQRSATLGHAQLTRTAHAGLMQAVIQTLTDYAPDPEAELRTLDEGMRPVLVWTRPK